MWKTFGQSSSPLIHHQEEGPHGEAYGCRVWEGLQPAVSAQPRHPEDPYRSGPTHAGSVARPSARLNPSSAPADARWEKLELPRTPESPSLGLRQRMHAPSHLRIVTSAGRLSGGSPA